MSPGNRKPGETQALQAEEVLRSLNVDGLHQSLPQFGITDVAPEVCPVNQVVSRRGCAGPGGRQELRSLSPMPTPALTGSPDIEDSCPSIRA